MAKLLQNIHTVWYKIEFVYNVVKIMQTIKDSSRLGTIGKQYRYKVTNPIFTRTVNSLGKHNKASR